MQPVQLRVSYSSKTLRSRVLLPALLAAAAAVSAQAPAMRSAGNGEFRALPDHVPSWATPEHLVAAVPADERMDSLTLVLALHADKQQAFDALLAAQQDPSSPEYHHWLTSAQIGDRFGLSQAEIDSLSDWLESEGLRVEWIAPARNFIGFSGTAGDVARAFQTELNTYDVGSERKMSIATDPMIPDDLAPMVKAVRGLTTAGERPLSVGRAVVRAKPEVTASGGTYYVGPADFAKIYDVPSTYTGKGITIGIVGGSRTNMADFTNFKSVTATTFANPTEVVPTAYGGVDPGPAETSPQSGGSIGDQLEATLDVMRAGSIAQGAKILLVVNKPNSNGSTNIWPDAQYLVQSNPAPAQVVNISFGSCESAAGAAAVNSWDGLFKQAAGEGISVFVASGDAGASGCDPYNAAPPASPQANSPNSICSSSYATCLGGTEFNDASDLAKYWSSSNGAGLESALSYIPEGAWNEPSNGGGGFQASATGGGVSQVIPTPSWQTGKGVPSAHAGRYTPDISFSSAGHDGYFGCLAAGGGSCVSGSSGIPFMYFAGTSAAAPDMAGITALLDQEEGKGEGNLNPRLYALAASTPSVFHDVTVATSGVSGCSVGTPSLCNNSVPGPSSLTGGQAGFLVTAGFDEATGLGSLDVGKFLASFVPVVLPSATTGAASGVAASSATVAGTVNPKGQSAQYWFAYGVSSTLAGAASSAKQTLSGSSAVAVSAKLTGLTPGTKYYFQLQASTAAGTAKGAIASFATPKGAQTITFRQPVSPVRYGVAPITLSATSSSKLPVTFTLVSGPGKVSGSTLTVKGAGTIMIAANQAGNTSYLAATRVTRSITVEKAAVTVTARSETMIEGSAVPALRWVMTGFVNGDTHYTATKGAPAMSTTATSKSTPGSYPIKIGAGTGANMLTSTSYSFKFVNGTMTVVK